MKVFTIFAIFLAFFIIDPLGLVEPVPVPPTPAAQSAPPAVLAPAVDAYPGPQTTVAPDAHPASELTRVFPTPPPGPKPTAEGEPCDECGPKGGR